ncbi:iron-containing alcohol dehydrogenase [Filifactor villosus]|uniref:Iron-containing alcohol dehydrogenase n=1 Tax=Filifactor villosus TaxID=29374 RepID=A0ABV9QPA9_9FIRM
MKSFVYHVPTKVYFGEGQLCHLGEELKQCGKKVLLSYGGGSIKKSGLYDLLLEEMKKANLEVFELAGIEPNPRIESVREGARLCKQHDIDVVLAVGGGSTIDAAKFIAAGACTDDDPWDFFVAGAPIDKALPLITVLTLSATGSEMDSCGVISNMETNDKLARYSDHVFPKVSFLDPTLTYTVNEYQTACGSADILSHIFEVYFNMNKDLYMLDTVMEGLMRTVIKYAPIALREPENYEARANLMWASSWAINGFINGGKQQAWSCHPMEHVLSAYYDITHGLGLAILTPRWMKYCLDETRVSKFYQFGVNVFGIDASLEPLEVAERAIEELSTFFFRTLGLKSRLSEVGIDDTHFEQMSQKACKGGVLAGFKPLGKEDIKKIFERCL